MLTITDLPKENVGFIQQCAALLVAGFRIMAPDGWTTLAEASTEVEECLHPEYICRVTVDETGVVLGWIGGRLAYDGHLWELHPVVVRPDRERNGIGRALVLDLEVQVQARGAFLFWGNRTLGGSVTRGPSGSGSRTRQE